MSRKSEVRAWRRGAAESGARVVLVPTMGYLHAGHLSLMEIARRSGDRVALSIFVNPLQFGPREDLSRYPRDLDRDLALAREAGVDLVFAPPVEEMYASSGPSVAVVPERGADVLCGASRPGHFRGVLTVVAKLFGLFQPAAAVFGEKDYQQLTLIRRMVTDLDMDVEIVPGPIVRERDGLAMSSRNAYLSQEERVRALALSEALARCRALFASGEREAAAFTRAMREAASPRVEVEYAEVVDPDTLARVERVGERAVCLIAARVGATRLIDNAILGA